MDNFLLGALAASLVIGTFAVIFIAKRQHAAGRPLPEPPAPRPAPVGTLSVVGAGFAALSAAESTRPAAARRSSATTSVPGVPSGLVCEACVEGKSKSLRLDGGG